MSLLGLDASTIALGFALGGPKDGAPKSGVTKLPGADEMVFDRTLTLAYETVAGLCKMIKAEHVYIEAPIAVMGSMNAVHTMVALLELTGALRVAATRSGASVSLPAISTIRKFFVGNGRLPKSEAKPIIMERCRVLGWDHGGDHNRADAMACWALGMSLRYPTWAPKATPLFGQGRVA